MGKHGQRSQYKRAELFLEMRTGLKKSTDGDFNIYESGGHQW